MRERLHVLLPTMNRNVLFVLRTEKCYLRISLPAVSDYFGGKDKGTGRLPDRVRDQKRHLCCHTHLDTSVSRTYFTFFYIFFFNVPQQLVLR
jgi:hypothetical protein